VFWNLTKERTFSERFFSFSEKGSEMYRKDLRKPTIAPGIQLQLI